MKATAKREKHTDREHNNIVVVVGVEWLIHKIWIRATDIYVELGGGGGGGSFLT